MIKYVAIRTVEQNTYEYYGNRERGFGLVEEEPTFVADDSVQVLPLYQVCEFISHSQLPRPLHLKVGHHCVILETIHAKGSEAVIFKGQLDGRPIIYRMYVRAPRKLRLLPPEIRKWVPTKPLIFQELNRAYIVAMEPLIELVWSQKIYHQSMSFLQEMERLGIVHGDISPGNVMMDQDGNVKFIDFSRGERNLGTPFYSKSRTDRQTLARVLLGAKMSIRLSRLYKEYPNMTEPEFFGMLLDQFPDNRELIHMAY